MRLARDFFTVHGLPMLRARYPQLVDRVAAGLVGDGSDCLGHDDVLSRDHDWGPGFCLWLDEADYTRYGAPLHRDWEALPKAFSGYRRSGSDTGVHRIGVFEINAFYQQFIGQRIPPFSNLDWLRIPERNLAACTSGEIFHDPKGHFAASRRYLLEHYPPEIHCFKLAALCLSAGQIAQYNLPRTLGRDEPYTSVYLVARLGSEIMQMVYLLNRVYAPYYKWLHRGLLRLPRGGEAVYRMTAALAQAPRAKKSCQIAAQLCEGVIDELQTQGLTQSTSHVLEDHARELYAQIKDSALRRLIPIAR